MSVLNTFANDPLGLQPDHPNEDVYDTAADQASSSTAQAGHAHARTDSTGSDQLAWSKERYQQETESIDELVDTLHETHIGGSSVTAWSEWAWDGGRNQWGRYRMSGGKYEHEWRDPDPPTASNS